MEIEKNKRKNIIKSHPTVFWTRIGMRNNNNQVILFMFVYVLILELFIE